MSDDEKPEPFLEVQCDEENNPPESLAKGFVNLTVRQTRPPATLGEALCIAQLELDRHEEAMWEKIRAAEEEADSPPQETPEREDPK